MIMWGCFTIVSFILCLYLVIYCQESANFMRNPIVYICLYVKQQRTIKKELLNFQLWIKCTSFNVWVRYIVWNLKFHTKYLERYDFYTTLKFQEFFDLRAHKCFETPPCDVPWGKNWPPWAHGEFTVSSRWPKWSQPAVTEPWPGPWLSCDLAVTEPWSPWLSCDLTVTELWLSRDWAVTSPWLSCGLAYPWLTRDHWVPGPWPPWAHRDNFFSWGSTYRRWHQDMSSMEHQSNIYSGISDISNLISDISRYSKIS